MSARVPDADRVGGIEGGLTVRGITKSFWGNVVLAQVDMSVEQGQVHALLGQNGAGKSTLIKILSGVYQADHGEVLVDSTPVTPGRPEVPVAFIHQDLGLVGDMTVAENMALVAGYGRRHHLISWSEVRRRARASLEALGLDLDPDASVTQLSAAERSMVAIARAMSMQTRFIVLDEPTAALPASDVGRLFRAIERLRAQDVGFLYITHRIDEVFQICDRVTVLRNGRRVLSAPVGQVTRESLVASIVGHDLPGGDRALDHGPGAFPRPESLPRSGSAPVTPDRPASVVIATRSLSVGRAGPVDIEVRRGEVLGLVGLAGAGQIEVGRALVGAARPSGGHMELEGRPYHPRSPSEALGHGVMGFVAGDRLQESIAAGLSVQENLYLNPGAQHRSPLKLIGHREEARRAAEVLRRFDVRPADPAMPIGLLSGGNQQKVVVARWVEAEVRALVLEDPTAGVDVGAKPELHAILRRMADAGAAVVVISSDFDEVVGICDRALIFGKGHVVAALEGEALEISALTSLASGSARASGQAARSIDGMGQEPGRKAV